MLRNQSEDDPCSFEIEVVMHIIIMEHIYNQLLLSQFLYLLLSDAHDSWCIC
jgi:hypothetical protein